MTDPVQPAVQNAENFVVKFVKDVWGKVESTDASINAWITKVTDGHTTLAIIAAAGLYWLVKPFIGLIVTLPAMLTKVILDALAVAVPALIGAVPSILGVALGLLAIVEVKNLLKKFIK